MVMFGSVMAYVVILCVLKCVVRRFYDCGCFRPFWLLLQVYLSRDEPWPPRVKKNVDDSLCWAVLDNFFGHLKKQ